MNCFVNGLLSFLVPAGPPGVPTCAQCTAAAVIARADPRTLTTPGGLRSMCLCAWESYTEQAGAPGFFPWWEQFCVLSRLLMQPPSKLKLPPWLEAALDWDRVSLARLV